MGDFHFIVVMWEAALAGAWCLTNTADRPESRDFS